MIDGYKELTPVIYGENAIKYLYTEQKKAEGEICFLLHWHDRMELTYVTEGTLRFVTEGEEFLVSAGELAVAGPGQMHGGFAVSEKVCYHTVMFDVERFYNGTAASEKYLRSLGNGELTFVEKLQGKRFPGCWSAWWGCWPEGTAEKTAKARWQPSERCMKFSDA